MFSGAAVPREKKGASGNTEEAFLDTRSPHVSWLHSSVYQSRFTVKIMLKVRIGGLILNPSEEVRARIRMWDWSYQ